MGWLLYIFYFGLFCFLISRLRLTKNCGLDFKLLLLLFVIRIGVSFFNAYIDVQYYKSSDVKVFHRQGLVEYHLLFSDPKEYIANFFRSNYDHYGGFTEDSKSFWNDTRTNIIAKTLSLFDIFSGANFYVNALFFNFFMFLGSVVLFRVFRKATSFPEWTIVVGIFLLPSLVYYTSGVHRDGLIFLSYSVVFYAMYKILVEKAINWKVLLAFFVSLALICFLRFFVFFALLPALFTWVILHKANNKIFPAIVVYSIVIVAFFSTTLLPQAYNLPEKIASKQAEFMDLGAAASSTLHTTVLKPSVGSYLGSLPEALNHVILRPYLTEHPSILYLPLSIEILCYDLVFLAFVVLPKKKFIPLPIILAMIGFSTTMFLIIGYTIPILGALVRYRSIFFPLILIPLAGNIDWSRITGWFHMRKI